MVFTEIVAHYHNETLARYIRKRKLTTCVNDLKNSRTPIVGMVLKYHFESQQFFTRSFKQLMGCTPSVCRRRQMDDAARQQLSDATHPCALCSYAQPKTSEKDCSGVTQRITLSPHKYRHAESSHSL